MIDFRQCIGGEWVDALGGGTWDLVNPATEEVIEQIPFGDGEDASAAIDAAADAFPAWSHLTAYERGAILEKAAAFVEANPTSSPASRPRSPANPWRSRRGSGRPPPISSAGRPARRSVSTGAGSLRGWPGGESTSSISRWEWWG